MITITRKIEFDAAHRVLNHESKCSSIHGHRYVVLIEATAPELDLLGRIIDFSVLKEKIGNWIDEYWDHTAIIFRKDEKFREAYKLSESSKHAYLMDSNPTAENMANYLLREICPTLMQGTGITITKVTIFETPNCSAEATL